MREENGTKEEKKEQQQNQISVQDFLTVRRIIGTLGVYFSLQLLRIFVHKSFASLCCGYLGPAPTPYVQDVILNLPNSYLRSNTILLDKLHV